MKKGVIVKMIIAAILIVVGVFGVVYNLVIVYNGDLKYLRYKGVDATITSVNSSYSDGDSLYQAVYSYEISGVGYTYSSSYTSDSSKYVIGDKAVIRYDSKNPSNSFLMEDGIIFNYLYLCISCFILIIGIKNFDKQYRIR